MRDYWIYIVDHPQRDLPSLAWWSFNSEFHKDHKICLLPSSEISNDFFIQENSICYELGVSTGALIKKLAKRHKKTKFIGIDIFALLIKNTKIINKYSDHVI